MDQLVNEIRLASTDPRINAILAVPAGSREKGIAFELHFNQNEEFFLKLDRPISYPSIKIHHDVRKPEPEPEYGKALLALVETLASLLPGCFHGLSYYFDPAEILKPCFFKLYKVEDDLYLYLLKIDLSFRSFEGRIIERGGNDFTSSYASDRLYLESELIPLSSALVESDRPVSFMIKQLVSQTWIGETGRGYLVHGIWMDSDLGKFFTKLFLPTGARIYPYFPLFCKYKSICASVVELSAEGRKRALPVLHRAIGFIGPEMQTIEAGLKEGRFSEDMPCFRELRAHVLPAWTEAFERFRVDSYLNERDMKEYSLVFSTH